MPVATARTPLTQESATSSIAQVLSSSALPSKEQTTTAGMDGSSNRSSLAGCPSDEPRQSTDSMRPLSRSASSASRNRLSLTLPIAPPTGYSSRPTPTSALNNSFPSTPADLSSGITSPADPADLVHAIAAQERRVLELKEELKHAEHDLKRLRRQYLHADRNAGKTSAAHQLRQHHSIKPAPSGLATPISSDEALAQRRSVELDRRRAVLAAQQQQTDGKRKMFRGKHAKTLSLVSPTRSVSASEFDETDDGQDSASTASAATAPANNLASGRSNLHQRNHSMLAKRATWNINPARNTPTGIKQFADDFRVGLWTFVEDIRQATVGEEAADRQGRTPRSARSTAVDAEGGDTIRASTTARPKASTLFDQAEPTTTPQKSTGSAAQRPKVTRQDSKNKRFSWTPLTDDLNDEDWSNWDSPTIGVPSPRWSGSTVSSGETSAAAGATPNGEMQATPSKPAASTPSNRNSLQFITGAASLEELPWQAINKLSPSNIKRTANNLMDQWEKSLVAPGDDNDNESPVSHSSGTDSALAYPHSVA